MVENYLSDNYGISNLDGNILERIVNFPIMSDDEENNGENAYFRSAVDTTWELAQSSEYVFAKIFGHFDVFPEIHGTCGMIYLTETVKQFSNEDLSLVSSTFSSFEDLSIKAKIALRILDALDELESLFNSPSLLCDMKPDHFGLSENGRIKILDGDHFMLRSVAESKNKGQPCEKHSDCDIFDCKGRCDLLEGKCADEIINNNLQMVCEKVFGGGLGSWLYTSKSLPPKLKKTITHCSNPSQSNDKVRLAADSTVNISLRKQIKEIIELYENNLRNKN